MTRKRTSDPGRRRRARCHRPGHRGSSRRQQLPRRARRRITSACGQPWISAVPGYAWYQSMMSGYYGGGGGMMGGSPAGWMMSQAGYQWMTGGTGAPGWMRGGTLPAA